MTKRLTERELFTILRERAMPCQARFAKEHGISLGYLNRVLTNNKSMGPKITNALKATKIILYEVVE